MYIKTTGKPYSLVTNEYKNIFVSNFKEAFWKYTGTAIALEKLLCTVQSSWTLFLLSLSTFFKLHKMLSLENLNAVSFVHFRSVGVRSPIRLLWMCPHIGCIYLTFLHCVFSHCRSVCVRPPIRLLWARGPPPSHLTNYCYITGVATQI